MKKNALTTLLVLIIIVALGFVGMLIMKPSHTNQPENPYAIKMDSIGLIPKEKYGDFSVSVVGVPLKNSIALAVDNSDNIYVSGDNFIYVLNRTGGYVRSYKTKTTATALAIDNNRLYAAFVNYVAVYSLKGKLISNWPIIEKNTYITSLAVKDNAVYVADAGNAVVREYDIDGAFVTTFGPKDKKVDVTAFVLPSNYFDVAVAPDHTLWAANTGKHKLVNFDSKGDLRSSWGETSSEVEGFCGCCNPSHFAIMQDGSFITAEKGIVRVKKYNPKGVFECAVAGPERFERESKGLDIAINSKNEILVLEPEAGIVHIFKENKK